MLSVSRLFVCLRLSVCLGVCVCVSRKSTVGDWLNRGLAEREQREAGKKALNLAIRFKQEHRAYTMSNILSVFNPPESRDLTEEEVKDCLPCQLMASFTGIVGGAYLSSGKIFGNEKPGDNPLWWKRSVRTGGVFMILFGLYRGGQGWLWDREHEYRK